MSQDIPMTREGYESLQEELKRLKREERPKVIRDIAEARGHGDLWENAEYLAAKERQSFIEGRIQEIEDKLARAQVIDPSSVPRDKVVFGARVLLEDMETGERVTYKIVGVDEANIKEGKISVTSPVGRALIGHGVDDTVRVKVPSGTKEYQVLDILFD
ncbi:MAG: transcription elongation factor GreA [Deltaproteobacteria bacterium]|nr:transcription elongation factor GreA [Deltaproteobacteria bacterium]MBI3077392.1 transcription elongation factor GreA [Deltaproteobacteria bacterium]